ncbi:MAG TPA: glycosyltransferase [Solirubrobacterales bacterium]|nr:glycosyltransferase [Solirubrobacterales bacterium]
MRVLIFHGYLLRGTGSNVYNASVAQALRRLGHDVHLLCQDRDSARLPWVDAVGSWGSRGLEVAPTRGGRPEGGADGSVTAYVPDIGGLLPVFVRDAYAGFEVKTFAELTDAELDRYLAANVAAVRDVVGHAGGVDATLANHLVMGPVITVRAGLRCALKVHGSDLSYTVLPEPERFRPYAEEAVAGANGVLVGSTHIAERLRAAVGAAADPKLRLGPPGVDTALFVPIDRAAAPERLRELAARLRAEGEGEWGRDPSRAADAVDAFAGADPRVVFVGKLIVSKGVDLLIAAWPLVEARHRGAGLLVAGFGGYEAGLRALIGALGAGDLAAAREVAARGRGLEGGEERPLAILSRFLADPPPGYAEAARGAAGSIALAGRIEHDEVAALVPAADALVFPSTFPEAFGMVAAEAAAAGVLPVSAAHSGALEVSRALAAELPPEAASLVSFAVTDGAVEAIARSLDAWLCLDEAPRRAAREALSGTAARLWSWDGVARSALAAAAGDLAELPMVERQDAGGSGGAGGRIPYIPRP